jgi:hypothetical protein
LAGSGANRSTRSVGNGGRMPFGWPVVPDEYLIGTPWIVSSTGRSGIAATALS